MLVLLQVRSSGWSKVAAVRRLGRKCAEGRAGFSGTMVAVLSAVPAFKIEVSGSLSVKPCLPAPVPGLRVLVWARVLPGHRAWPGASQLWSDPW